MSAHTATEIQAMVRNMDDSKKKHASIKDRTPQQYVDTLKEENATLFDLYPSIFMLHIEDKLDGTFFEMLKEKRKMEKGEATEDEASVRIGQTLFNRWVAPILRNSPTPSVQSYSEYYEELKKSR